MSFFEVETSTVKEGCQADHDDIIRRWFAYLRAHHDDVFPECKSARYFCQVDRNTGRPTTNQTSLEPNRKNRAADSQLIAGVLENT